MTPRPWSYSALSAYRNCPKQFYHTRVAKDVRDPPNEAGMWGDYVHREFEKYLNGINAGQAPKLPANLSVYLPYLTRIAGMKGEMHIEGKWAINTALEFVDWGASDVWARAIIDVLHVNGTHAIVTDHKTGKQKKNDDQLRLFALFTFLKFPKVQTVQTRYAWLKTGRWGVEDYERENESWMWQTFMTDLRRYREAFRTLRFEPRPSGLCNGWCPVTDCAHWKPKRS